MNKILNLLFFLALVSSGLAQTRNVLVGTNDVVVSPSNFWNANASNARTGLGLGSAATNPSTAFQPASLTLSNFATSGVIGVASGGTGATNAASARSNLGATTAGGNLFTLANPSSVSFLRINSDNTVSALNASDFRTALGVGSGSGSVTSVGFSAPLIFSVSGSPITSSGTISLALANQSARNFFASPSAGGAPVFRPIDTADLPSLAVSNVSGLQAVLDEKLSTTGTAASATNVTGIVGLVNGGTGGTSAATARSGIGATTIGGNLFTLINPSAVRFLRINADNTVSALSDSDFRSAISLGSAATNSSTAFQPAASNLTNLANNNAGLLTNIQAANIVGTVTNVSSANLNNVSGVLSISNGGTGATNASQARANLELGSTNAVSFSSVFATNLSASVLSLGNGQTGEAGTLSANNVTITSWPDFSASAERGFNFVVSAYDNGGASLFPVLRINQPDFNPNKESVSFVIRDVPVTLSNSGLVFQGTGASLTRSNLGLSFWVTNTNTPVFVDTNGAVVFPTNFSASIGASSFQGFTPTINATNNVATSRHSVVFSGATNIGGITSTLIMPTNALSGDYVTIVHKGGSNSATEVFSGTNNLAVVNVFDSVIEFVYSGAFWESVGSTDPILGEPIVYDASSGNVIYSSTSNLTFTNTVVFSATPRLSLFSNTNGFLGISSNGTIVSLGTNITAGSVSFFGYNGTNAGAISATNARTFLGFSTNLNNFWESTNQGSARTNLGLVGSWLTNSTESDFISALGLGTNDFVEFGNLVIAGNIAYDGYSFQATADEVRFGAPIVIQERLTTNNVFDFESSNDIPVARSNLGLGGGITTNFQIRMTNATNTLQFSNGILTNITTP